MADPKVHKDTSKVSDSAAGVVTHPDAGSTEAAKAAAQEKVYEESKTPQAQAKASLDQIALNRKEHLVDRGDGKPVPMETCPVCGHGLVRSIVPGDYAHSPSGRPVCAYDPKHPLGKPAAE